MQADHPGPLPADVDPGPSGQLLDPAIGTLLLELGQALCAAVEEGWPLWLTAPSPGYTPRLVCHDFSVHRLKDGAKIDFSRGTAADDKTNKEWRGWFYALPLYRGAVGQIPMWTNSSRVLWERNGPL